MAFLKKGWLQKYEKEKEQLKVNGDKVRPFTATSQNGRIVLRMQ